MEWGKRETRSRFEDRDPRGVGQEATARSSRLPSSQVRPVPVGHIQALQPSVVEAGLRDSASLSEGLVSGRGTPTVTSTHLGQQGRLQGM